MLLLSLIFAAQAASHPFVPEPPSDAPPAFVYKTPKGFEKQKPKNNFRLAQYVLPKAKDDKEAPLLVVYWFGPQGVGSVDANFERWASQVSTPLDKAKRQSRKQGGHPLEQIEAQGRFIAATTPGSSERFDKAAFSLLGAIWNTPRGPLYFKLTGPQKSVDLSKKNFTEFLKSLALEKNEGVQDL